MQELQITKTVTIRYETKPCKICSHVFSQEKIVNIYSDTKHDLKISMLSIEARISTLEKEFIQQLDDYHKKTGCGR